MALTLPVSEIVERTQNSLLGKHVTWERVLLGEIATILNGYAFKSKNFSKDDGFPLIRIRDVGKNFTNTNYIGDFDSRYIVEKGDLLIGMDGDFHSGIWMGKQGLLNQRVCKVILKDEFFSLSFLRYLLPGYLKAINDFTSSVTVKHLSSRTLIDIPLPLPPINEQKRIVAEIEKQFSRLDEAVDNLKRVKANLKRYKASVLKSAVEGKLTEEWRKKNPDVEPAEKLLERVLVERRKKWEETEFAKMTANGKIPKTDKWKKKYKEAVIPKGEYTFKIPDSWSWSNLGQLAWSVKDGPHYSPKYSKSGIPFISGDNIRPEGINFSSTKYISKELHAKLSERCKPEIGDLLYTKGGTTGIARVNTENRDFNVWVHVAVLKLVDSINRFYLQHALNSPYCYKQSQKYTHGVGNQDLGLTRLIWITVPLPPMNEQKVIVQMIEKESIIVAKIEKQIENNLKRAERLRQSILKKAFSGKLVPQNPNDEPARILLEKIKQKIGGKPEKKIPNKKKAGKMITSNIKRDLLMVLSEHPNGLKPEVLLSEANYTVEEIDIFYAHLKKLSDKIEQLRPEGKKAFKWPSEADFILRLRR